MLNEANEVLERLLATRIDAAGAHCLSPDDDEDGSGDEAPKPEDPQPSKDGA